MQTPTEQPPAAVRAGFVDVAGDEWTITLTLADLLAVKKEFGLCLVDLTDEDRAARRSAADLGKLVSDLPQIAGLACFLCAGQVAARGLSKEDFAARFDGDTLREVLTAVRGAILDFSLPRSQKGRGAELARRRAAAITEALGEEILGRVEPTEKELAEISREISREIAGQRSASPASAGSSPASSDSTPGP